MTDNPSPVCFRCGSFPAEQTVECPRWCWNCSERTRLAIQSRVFCLADLQNLYAPLVTDYRMKRLPKQYSFRGECYDVALILRSLLERSNEYAEYEALKRYVYYLNEWWFYTRLDRDLE